MLAAPGFLAVPSASHCIGWGRSSLEVRPNSRSIHFEPAEAELMEQREGGFDCRSAQGYGLKRRDSSLSGRPYCEGRCPHLNFRAAIRLAQVIFAVGRQGAGGGVVPAARPAY